MVPLGGLGGAGQQWQSDQLKVRSAVPELLALISVTFRATDSAKHHNPLLGRWTHCGATCCQGGVTTGSVSIYCQLPFRQLIWIENDLTQLTSSNANKRFQVYKDLFSTQSMRYFSLIINQSAVNTFLLFFLCFCEVLNFILTVRVELTE